MTALNGKTALVTGASRGIGKAVALAELAYAMAKGAIDALCRSLAQEVGGRGCRRYWFLRPRI
jgi:NAD(P)-dependent dehydrogenase (short-subunit alcohol dehydrogenase family)